jgi:hypothetical protein
MNLESMLKGRMAETLIEELLRQSGNIVYRFGYEAIVQNLVQLEESFDRYNEVGERIRAIPDFIVIDTKGKPSFVEVKFRWKAEMDSEEDRRRLERLQKYWEAKLIIVNCWRQPYFEICTPPYIVGNKLNLHPLVDEKEWKISKEAYATCEGLVHKYLSPTLVPPKK